jgi:hypothetical protein
VRLKAAIAAFALIAPSLAMGQQAKTAKRQAGTFAGTIKPFIARNCAACHNAEMKTGGLDLTSYRTAEQALKDRERWERVVQKVESGEMPPEGIPRPSDAHIARFKRWFETQWARIDARTPPDPGRVTARRLNRTEYNHTVRDLLAVDVRPADDFPADDSGYGFDNIGDVLSLSPVLMEKYLSAAEKIARAAIPVDPPVKPTRERYQLDRLPETATKGGVVRARYRAPVDADYDIRGGGGRVPDGSAPRKIGLWIDGKQAAVFEIVPVPDKPRAGEQRLTLKAGEHAIMAAFLDSAGKPVVNAKPPADPVIEFIEIRGPYNQVKPEEAESYKRVFACGHAPGAHSNLCARSNMAALARRAYRRPVRQGEVEALARFVELAQKQGETFEQGMRVALQAMLVSPHFLFRVERDPKPGGPSVMHRISEHELATRLSYFLWSSMPDEELLVLADRGALRRPRVLQAQIARMLRDPKARSLADNFAGQWLQIRNLESIQPDPDRFRDFDAELRDAMWQETVMFFETVVREDRSILDFIDSRFTFLNERLAKHYGIEGVEGPEFRRVTLRDAHRGGVLTQASVLTVSSYPTRTSPVLRGKWILENILNAAPPPPPGDVPVLDEAAVGNTGTMREQLEKHRSDPTCSSCHVRMDPLGFGLENFDAIGAWRTTDGKFPLDTTGTLPGGKTFRTPAELKAILRADAPAFARCLTEKMLTYALGRGLETYDKKAVHLISRRVALGNYRFSRLVTEIVTSMPFQMRRGESHSPTLVAGGK